VRYDSQVLINQVSNTKRLEMKINAFSRMGPISSVDVFCTGGQNLLFLTQANLISYYDNHEQLTIMSTVIFEKNTLLMLPLQRNRLFASMCYL
jgi:hypothetical protein